MARSRRTRRCLLANALGSFPAATTTEDRKVTNSDRSVPVPARRGGTCGFLSPHADSLKLAAIGPDGGVGQFPIELGVVKDTPAGRGLQ
jgi:hypothetical protein